MRFTPLLFLAVIACAVAAPSPEDLGLTARDTSVLESRADACGRLCGNNKGKCPNKDKCKSQCNMCLKKKKGFFPSTKCGCVNGNKCKKCEGCTQGCGSLDTDAAIAACYFSCASMDICKNC